MTSSINPRSEIQKGVERTILIRKAPKKFNGVPYYFYDRYLSLNRADQEANNIRAHDYLARVWKNPTSIDVWRVYVRRK